MDNKEPMDNIFGFSLTQKIKDDLSISATWARVIALAGGANTLLSLVVAFADGSAWAQIIITICNIVLYVYLYNFSSKIKQGVESHNQYTLNDGLKSLHQYFKLYGIILIISILVGIVYYFTLMSKLR